VVLSPCCCCCCCRSSGFAVVLQAVGSVASRPAEQRQQQQSERSCTDSTLSLITAWQERPQPVTNQAAAAVDQTSPPCLCTRHTGCSFTPEQIRQAIYVLCQSWLLTSRGCCCSHFLLCPPLCSASVVTNVAVQQLRIRPDAGSCALDRCFM
jgi:hypothetical protein